MRRVFLSLALTAVFFALLELGVRGLYAMARSTPFLGWVLLHERDGVLEIVPEDGPFLLQGFCSPTQPETGATTAWTCATRAELLWPVVWRRDHTVVLRVSRFPHESAAGLTLTVSLNGREVRRALLPQGWVELELRIPAAEQEWGANRITLETPRLFPASLLADARTVPRQRGALLARMEVR